MPIDLTPPQTAFEMAAHETLVDSLRNAHALEKQVISVLESHLKLMDDYPELHARLTEHVVETREQARRLEAALEACGSSASVFKDTFLSMMGMGQSSAQGFAEDAVLKAMLADTMTEHLEIASYRTLINLADMAGKSDLRSRLEESLHEEEAMAQWFEDNMEAITRRYVELKEEADAPTKAAPKADAEKPEGATAQGEPTLWQTLEHGGEPVEKPASGTASQSGMTPRDLSVKESPAEGTTPPADPFTPRPTVSANRPPES